MADEYITKNGLLLSKETKDAVAVDDEVKTTITEIKLPPEQTDLPPYLFSGCESLSKVFMPTKLNGFPEGLFQGCSSMTEIPFRAGITEVFPNTFEGCSSLKSIIFPESINAIRSRACADCTSLETVVLPPRMYALADDAFDGCPNIHNIRIASTNNLFYISDKDGCLYERNVEGDDILKIKLAGVTKSEVGFFKENVDDETDSFFTDEDITEEDDTFSSEIGLGDEENIGDEKMEDNNVDDMLADIMGDEKERQEVSADIGVSDKESEVLSEMMDVMSESSMNKGAKVSDDELANLFAEPVEEKSAEEPVETDINKLDNKTQILVNSVTTNKIIICEPSGEVPEDFDLFVIAEKPDFSEKLISCAKKIARIQDFSRIIMLSGLPFDNDEFTQFYQHFISQRNVLLACIAESPSSLSDYCKQICEQSRISLEKEEIAEQRKRVGIKNNNLIKLIIRDVE